MIHEIRTTTGRILRRIGDDKEVGDQVVLVYEHNFNRKSRVNRFKDAIFLTYIRPEYCLIYVFGNSTASKIKLSQVYKVTGLFKQENEL